MLETKNAQAGLAFFLIESFIRDLGRITVGVPLNPLMKMQAGIAKAMRF
ncbi:MAG: hypothetical protein KJO73_02985 [Croceitalea sp.]|nr:hypothetical protein [Croceitalea sp.]